MSSEVNIPEDIRYSNAFSKLFKILVCCFSFSLFIVLSVITYSVSESKKLYDLTTENQSFLSKEYEFKFNTSKNWSEQGKLSTGAQYDCTFINHSRYTLENWTCMIILPYDSFVDSYWSGRFNQFNEKLFVYPLDYNYDVPFEEPVTFGFILHSRKIVENPEFKIIFTKSIDPFKFPVFVVFFVLSILFFVILIVVFISDLRFSKMLVLLNQTFDTIVNIVDQYDEYTYQHSRNVAYYSMLLAKRLGLNKKDVRNIYFVGLVHDIGKISMMRNMLNKHGKFTEEERELIKNHTIAGGETLKDFTAIPQIKDGALYHHERYDGTGYPEGLKGKNIPLFARIICIADSFDVMTSKRCYQDQFETEEVIKELEICSGTQFDPDIVPHMISLVNDGEAPLRK